MNEIDQFAIACEQVALEGQWADISTQRAGTVMLLDLLRMFGASTEFRRRHDLSFALRFVDGERVLFICHAGLPAGRWEPDGNTLKMYAADYDVPLVAETSKEAFELTVYFVNDTGKIIARYVVAPALIELATSSSEGAPQKLGFIE